MRRTRREQRGQGTVELALGTLLFVTILLAGIQFAEIGFLSLKVQEASNFALWHATTQRAHQTGNNQKTNEYLKAIASKGASGSPRSAEERYRDFSADEDGTGTTITQVAIRGSKMEVTCRRQNSVEFQVPTPGASVNPARFLGDVYAIGAGGITCDASSRLTSTRNPREFAQRSKEGGFFTELNNKMGPFLTVCSLGRPKSNGCEGSYPILLGDWGLIGTGEGREVPFSDPDANPVYYGAAETVYSVLGGGSGAQPFATEFGGGSPGGIRFLMSFIHYPGTQGRPGGHGQPSSFATSGVERGRAARSSRFLGLP